MSFVFELRRDGFDFAIDAIDAMDAIDANDERRDTVVEQWCMLLHTEAMNRVVKYFKVIDYFKSSSN